MAEFTFRQVRYFVTAARSGQISQAAIELNVSQSAVTTSIKVLEEVTLGRHGPLTPENARAQALSVLGAVAA